MEYILAIFDIKYDGQITFGNLVTVTSTILAISAIYWKQQLFNTKHSTLIEGLQASILAHKQITDGNSVQITMLRESDIKYGKDLEFIKERVQFVPQIAREQVRVAKEVSDAKDVLADISKNKS